MSATKTILREEGMSGLIRGIGPRIVWISIGGSIFFSVLEGMEALLSTDAPVYTGPRVLSPAP